MAAMPSPTIRPMVPADVDQITELFLREDWGDRRRYLEFVIGHGRDWAEAFDDVEWRADDMLMIGSSESGPIARVFLGSRATKIVRHAPVPVLIVPRGAAKELSRE